VYYPSTSETACVRAWLDVNAPHVRSHTVPAYAYESFPEHPESNLSLRQNLIFVAGFAHPPNADAAEWFVRDVLPIVRLKHPDLHLDLVGSNPCDAVVALQEQGIDVTGFVTDEELALRYRAARVVVAPLRYGAGVKGKVIEAMHSGVPCVTTSAGAQGLAGTADFLAATDDPATFAAHVVELLEDDAAWRRASVGGQAYIRSHFTESAQWQVFSLEIDTPMAMSGRRAAS
jgi:glycosyltransferase involved in cell wall biosynthesis